MKIFSYFLLYILAVSFLAGCGEQVSSDTANSYKTPYQLTLPNDFEIVNTPTEESEELVAVERDNPAYYPPFLRISMSASKLTPEERAQETRELSKEHFIGSEKITYATEVFAGEKTWTVTVIGKKKDAVGNLVALHSKTYFFTHEDKDYMIVIAAEEDKYAASGLTEALTSFSWL